MSASETSGFVILPEILEIPMKAPHFSAIAAILSLALPALGQDASKVTFVDHVLPILENKCNNCHNPDEAKGGLDLTSFGAALTGGSGGEVAVPEDPSGSRLYTLAAGTEEPIMPPKGTKMDEKELKLVSDWIKGGMLETSSSKARKSDKPKIDFDSISATGKPEGPPAMPEHLILQPALVTERPNAVPALAHSPWAPILAVAGQKQVLLYHSGDFDLLGVLPYPEGFPQTLSFSPNGAYLSCGGGRAGKSGNVVAWDIKSGERIIEVGKEYDIVLGADVSPDLKNAILGGPGRNIKLWDTVSGEQINSIKKHPDWLLTAAYSPDGVIFATGGRNGGLYVWEAATGYEFYTLKGHTAGVTDVAWRADGNVLASCSEDGQVILWEMSEGKEIKKWEAHRGGVLGIAFAQNGNIATVGRDKTVKIWQGDGKQLKSITASDDVVLSVAISHDGKRVFTGDWHGAIKVWDVEAGTELGQIDPNPPTIDQQLAYSQQRIGELTGQLPKLEEGVKTISAELAAAKSALAEIDKKVAEATKTRDAQKGVAAKLDGTVKSLTPQIEQGQADVNAKNAALKKLNDEITALTAAVKPKQDSAAKLTETLKANEAALAAATAKLNAAKAEAAKPALDPEKQKQHDQLAAARAAAEKAKQATDAAVVAKTQEQQAAISASDASKKTLTAAATKLKTDQANAAKANESLKAASAARQQADAAVAAASKDGKTPPADLVSSQKAAHDKENQAKAAANTANSAAAAAQKAFETAAAAAKQAEQKAAALVQEIAQLKQDQPAKTDAFNKAEAAFKPLREAAAAGQARVAKARTDLAAATTAHQGAEKDRNDTKAKLDGETKMVADSLAKIESLKKQVEPAKKAAEDAAAALAAKQKQLADAKTQLAASQAELKKAEDTLAGAAKEKEAATANVAAIVKKEADTRKSIELAKAELKNSQFLYKKWQAAALNLTAVQEEEALGDMEVKLEDMMEEETEAKESVKVAEKARVAAEQTLSKAEQTVKEGSIALKQKSSEVLERALQLVSNRAVAELREEVIGSQPAIDVESVTLASLDTEQSSSLPPVTIDDEEDGVVKVVAAEALAYKTPEELNEEVASLKDRLSELEGFLKNTYTEADKTRTMVDQASKVARETPKVVAERAKAENEAAKALADAEAERKRQEAALEAQKKEIERLRAEYLSTLPKRQE